jgi:UDP-N-acetylmuramoyl-tripeptide--D-alanyl-D-alanine ligase
LPEVHESPGRGNQYQVQFDGGTALLLDYTRNASMPALHASLEVLAEMVPKPGGKRIAVLGDMTELDGDPAAYHRDVASVIERLGIDLVFGVGELTKHMYDALPAEKRGSYAEKSDILAWQVKEAVQPGDVILAQGWRPLKLNNVIKALVGQANYVPWE